MNCKPGGLAVIVRSNDKSNIGMVVRTHRLIEGRIRVPDHVFHFEPVKIEQQIWLVESLGRKFIYPEVLNVQSQFAAYQDSCLRPLLRPGDEAADESKAWLPPVPLPTIDPSLLPVKEHA